MKTLEQFVNECGGRTKAAVAIGIDQTTLWRWSQGRSKPRGLALRRLQQLNIRPAQTARINKIARFVQVRPTQEAFAKNDEEMLSGMLSMTPAERVADADQLRVHLWRLGHSGSRPRGLERVARIVRRSDVKE